MDTNHFTQKLEEELRAVEKAIGENSSAPQKEDATATESDEVADKIEALEEDASENMALRPRLADIKRALEKIGSGTYGVCEVGGETIEEERLEANPAARTCIAHMETGSALA